MECIFCSKSAKLIREICSLSRNVLFSSKHNWKTDAAVQCGHERFKMDAWGVREHEKQVEYPLQGMAGVLFDNKLQQK